MHNTKNQRRQKYTQSRQYYSYRILHFLLSDLGISVSVDGGDPTLNDLGIVDGGDLTQSGLGISVSVDGCDPKNDLGILDGDLTRSGLEEPASVDTNC